VAVDLQGLLRSGLLTCLSGSPVRVGFANAREFATLGYNRRVQVPTPEMHAVERYLLVAGALGIEPAGEPDFTIAVGRDEARWARDFLSGLGPEHGPVVLMNPSARWESKRWPANSFAVLADALVRKHAAAVLFTGSPEDRAVVGRVQGLMSQTSIDLAGGTTLKQFIALLAQADLLVCNDSGPMHLAAALGTPLVAFFGPTNPVRTGPYAQARRCVILRKPQDCSPCYRRQCRSGKCLAAVTSAEALEAAESLLEVDGKQAPARNSK
jgi:lipopolysaccharide heptosyltransferase II